MKVAVVGGGNIGTLMAAEIAAKGHEVTILTSKPQQWSKNITVFDAHEHLIVTGELTQVTADPSQAISDAEIIFVTVPAQLFAQTAQRISPFLNPNQAIGIVPGAGGAEFAFRAALQLGCPLFGLQRVHSIARLKEYGHSVYMLGRKPKLEVGAIPSHQSSHFARLVSDFLDLPCTPLSNYLSLTLTPSNPILHTTRLCSMFQEYHTGVFYPANLPFYETWDDASSTLLIACDTELQTLCAKIPLDLSAVISLTEYYESQTPAALTAKIRSIKAFKGILSPMSETPDGWIPDFSSRYFVSDFCYGLKIIQSLARLYQVPTPSIDRVWQWYANLVKPNDFFKLDLDRQELIQLYS